MNIDIVKQYLRIDYDDDDVLLEIFIDIAKKYVTNGFSEYDENNNSHNILMLKAVKYLYDNREDNKDPIYLSIKLQEFLGGSSE